jgi:hypothetical protein
MQGSEIQIHAGISSGDSLYLTQYSPPGQENCGEVLKILDGWSLRE